MYNIIKYKIYEIQRFISNIWHQFLFNLTRKIVFKYFSNGLTKIDGSGKYNQPIAWTWTFEDKEYEKYKERKNKIK